MTLIPSNPGYGSSPPAREGLSNLLLFSQVNHQKQDPVLEIVTYYPLWLIFFSFKSDWMAEVIKLGREASWNGPCYENPEFHLDRQPRGGRRSRQ